MTKEELFKLKIDEPEEEIFLQARKRWDEIAKPVDGLGDFEELLCRIAAIQGRNEPDISAKALLIMCADNGIVKEGVSQSGQEVTLKVAGLMGEAKSSVGILTKGLGLDIYTYDVGINSIETPEGVINKKTARGTEDFLRGPAMSRTQCLEAIGTGIDAVRDCAKKGYGIIATGEMGIGNTTTAAALVCALTGKAPEECAGRGAGLSREGLERKLEVIREGLRLYGGDNDGGSKKGTFELLRCLGGLDIAALAGVFIGGAIYKIPVVMDGFISAAASLVSERLLPGCRAYMLASHLGREKGMALVLKELSLKAVIDANMALGEGSGAVMLLPLLDMAMSLYKNGTVFKGASIEQYERFGE